MTRSYRRGFVLAVCLIATAGSHAFADEPAAFANSADGTVPTTLAADSYYADSTSENTAAVPLEPSEIRELGPTWTFRAGALVLERSDERPRQLIVVRPIGLTALDASQFDHDMRGGPEINAIRHFADFDVEFRYFSVEDTTGVSMPLPNTPPPVFATGTVTFVGPAGDYTSFNNNISVNQYTELISFELNFRKTVSPYLAVLAGFRHIDFNDRIIGSMTFNGIRLFKDMFSMRGYNRMDGFQIGGESVLWRPGAGRFRIEGSAKVGIFGDATSNYGNFNMQMATASGGHVALASEWSVTAAYQITPHLAARFGYEGLLLDGVALASEQVGVLNPHAGTGTIENSGTPIYQGLVANLEYAW